MESGTMRVAGFWYLRFAAGAACGLAALMVSGEALLRLAPPADLEPFLGADSSLVGPYVADPITGVTYRSFENFRAEYGNRLAELGAQNGGRPVWAIFGNSFVQAPGMLGDTAQAALPGHQIFFLRRNEPIYIRIAQFRLLLASGWLPERAFFVLLPIDLAGIALDPVAALTVTPGGGIGQTVRKPALLAPVLDNSRLALVAWTRSGRHRLLPGFRGEEVLGLLPQLVTDELVDLIAEIAQVARQRGVPVTIVFIPGREQIMGQMSTVPQDAIGNAAKLSDIDFLDSTPAFLAEANRSGLLIADGHLSDRGNAILLSAILSHITKGAEPAEGAQ